MASQPDALRKNLVEYQPEDIPGLVAFWHFTESGAAFTAVQGEPYTLVSQSGPLAIIKDETAPLGGTALELTEGQWLNLPRAKCPRLDIHGRDGHLTVFAWINRAHTSYDHCEFIAGQWNETNRGRQYGLFLNIRVWEGVQHEVCGHLSNTGGPSPAYRYCMDGAMGASPVPWGTWSSVAMSYDGSQGYAWLNGRLDANPGINPYSLAGGLHDGGKNGSNFTVGAVNRSAEMGNFFAGKLAGLAVYERALTPAEIFALAQL